MEESTGMVNRCSPLLWEGSFSQSLLLQLLRFQKSPKSHLFQELDSELAWKCNQGNQSQNKGEKICGFCPSAGQSNCNFLSFSVADRWCQRSYSWWPRRRSVTKTAGLASLALPRQQAKIKRQFSCLCLSLSGHFALISQWPGPILAGFASPPCIMFGMGHAPPRHRGPPRACRGDPEIFPTLAAFALFLLSSLSIAFRIKVHRKPKQFLISPPPKKLEHQNQFYQQ